MIGLRLLHEKMQQLPDFPPKLRVLVEHLIVSHHGELEYGSPKVPLFPEAMLLHHLDNLDSKMECMRALAEKDRHIEGCWTGYSPSLERSILKKAKYLDDEPPREASAAPAEFRRACISRAGSRRDRTAGTSAIRLSLPSAAPRPLLLSRKSCNKPGAKILDAQPRPETLMQSSSSTSRSGLRILQPILAGLFIAGLFLSLTWRGLLIYYTGDDMMNLYGYWSKPVSSLVKANIFFWTPYYRPFGGVIYRTLFAIFGFNPYPLYVAVLRGDAGQSVARLYGVSAGSADRAEFGAIAILLYCFHGKLDYLYYNAGSLYDVFCFLFYFLALLIYLRARLRDRFLGVWGTIGFLVCLVCALNSKEMGATLPVIVLLYELLFHPPDFRSLRALFRWCFHEGRMALLGALCVLIYIPAKLGANGIGQDTAYIPSYTLTRWLADTGTFLGDLLYRNDPSAAAGRQAVHAGRCSHILRCVARHRDLDAIPRDVVRAALLRHRAAAGIVYPAPPGIRALSAAGGDGALWGGHAGAFQGKPVPADRGRLSGPRRATFGRGLALVRIASFLIGRPVRSHGSVIHGD